MTQIKLEWDVVKHAYPKRPLTGPLKVKMDSIPGTPCCVQMSHALNAAGSTVGNRSNRRLNEPIITSLGKKYYLLAVDEMKWYLEQNFGLGEEISTDDNGKKRSIKEQKAALDDRTGILVFSKPPWGEHTELWDTDHMHQRDISEHLFESCKVLFWDVMITAEA